MGIDYLTCSVCGKGFPDCSDYVGCECGIAWCSDKCAEKDGFVEKYPDGIEEIDEDSEYPDSRSCNFCRGENFTDAELLEFILKLDSVTRKELVEMYKLLKKAEE